MNLRSFAGDLNMSSNPTKVAEEFKIQLIKQIWNKILLPVKVAMKLPDCGKVKFGSLMSYH